MPYDTFSTNQVRLWNTPRHKNSIDIPTPIHCTALPIGLNSLDVDCSANLRIRALIDSNTNDTEYVAKATVHLNAWGDTILYSAGCTWLDVCKHDRDFQFGTYTTGSMSWNPDKPSIQVKFDKPYASAPKIVVWLKELDVSNKANCRVKASASDITATGFTLTIDTWADTTMYTATATWIAYPSNRSNITSGNLSTSDIRSWDKAQLQNGKNIEFDRDFECPPRVLVALNGLDVSNRTNLRIKTVAKDITAQDMTLSIDSWFDTTIYWAGVSYLAIQDY